MLRKYICQPGQAIKDGRVEYSSIADRSEAEVDAVQRLRNDPTIAKLAYYAVKDDGGFRSIYSYDNPNASKVPERRSALDDLNAPSLTGPRKKPMFSEIRAVFEEDSVEMPIPMG